MYVKEKVNRTCLSWHCILSNVKSVMYAMPVILGAYIFSHSL